MTNALSTKVVRFPDLVAKYPRSGGIVNVFIKTDFGSKWLLRNFDPERIVVKSTHVVIDSNDWYDFIVERSVNGTLGTIEIREVI